MNTKPQPEPAQKKRSLIVTLLPLLIFIALAGVFTMQLLSDRDASDIPSALLDKPAPMVDLPALGGMSFADGSAVPGVLSADFKGQVTVVNVWASWCVPCRDEHPVMMQLAQDKRIHLVGLNYKDKPENAQQFLNSLGNPYAAIGVDSSGRAAIDWGVYGVPETFIVNREGTIIHKHVGPVTEQQLKTQLMPIIEQAL